MIAICRAIALAVLMLASGTTFAQTRVLYDEAVEGDLMGSGPGRALRIDAPGTYLIKGNLSAPGDQQDRYTLTVVSGLKITRVDYVLAGPPSFNGFLEFNGKQADFSPGAGGGTFAFSYPLAAGDFFGIHSASYSPGEGNNWQITLVVAR